MTATGTGALRELRTRLAEALHRCFCERHRIPVDGYGDDGSMILEENGWFDQADAAIAAIAEAGLVLSPAGGTVTAEQVEALKVVIDYAELHTPAFDVFFGGVRDSIATLKAIVERGTG